MARTSTQRATLKGYSNSWTELMRLDVEAEGILTNIEMREAREQARQEGLARKAGVVR